MFKTSYLVLLTLVLNVQLCSSAPIREDVAAGDDVPVIVKEPEPIFIEDRVSDEADGTDDSQLLAPREPLVAVPHKSSEEEAVPEEGAFAEASPDETTEDVEPVVAVESEQHYVDDPAPEATILVIPLEDSKDEAPEENAEDKEDAVENTSPDQHDLVDPAAAAPISIIPVGASEDGASKENAVEEEAAPEELLLVVPDTNTEAEPAALPVTPEEEKPVILVPAELETEKAGHGEPVTEESAPEEPAVIVPVETAEQEPDQEEQHEAVSIMSSETKVEEAPEEHAKKEEAAVLVVLEENTDEDPAENEEPLPSTLEEEESAALLPVELEIKEECLLDPAAEETAPQELAPEDPVVIVPLNPAEEELELEEHVGEESIPLVSSDKEVPEAEAAGVPEKNAGEDPEGQGEEYAEETASTLEKTAVIVLVEPTYEEPAPEDPILIIPLENIQEDAQEDNREEELVKSDPLPKKTALEEDTAGDSDAETLIISVTGTPSEGGTIETAMDPDEEVLAAASEVHAEAEILTEAPVEPVTDHPALAVYKAQIVPAPLEGSDGTSVKARSGDFKATAILTEDEPEVLVSRGAVLGAAFFVLMSFIIIGFVGMTVVKKLR